MSFLLLFSFYFLFRILVLSLVLYASSLMRPLSAFALTFIGLSSMEHTVSLSNQMKKCKYQHWIIYDWCWGISMFPRDEVGENRLRFEGNKIHCPPRDQALSYLLYSKTKQKQILKNALKFHQHHQATFNCTLWSCAIGFNISQATVNCFLFDIIVFAMLPTHCIWP